MGRSKGTTKKSNAKSATTPMEALVIGGYQFSGHKKGILAKSVDPGDKTTRDVLVVPSNEDPGNNDDGMDETDFIVDHVPDQIVLTINFAKDRHRDEFEPSDKLRSTGMRQRQRKAKENLETKALVFCRLVNKILRRHRSVHFVGCEVIYKMVSSGLAKTRREALDLGIAFSKKLRLFYRIEGRFKVNAFSDDHKLYRFRPEALLSVIMKTPMVVKGPLHPKRPKRGKKAKTKTKTKGKNKPVKAEFTPGEQESVLINERMPSPCSQFAPSLEESTSANGSEHAAMEPIYERGESSCETEDEYDEESVYTEVTLDRDNTSLHMQKSTSSRPQHYMELDDDDDASSYMEITVCTGTDSKQDTYSYYEELVVSDGDAESDFEEIVELDEDDTSESELEYMGEFEHYSDTLSATTPTPPSSDILKSSEHPPKEQRSPTSVTSFDACLAAPRKAAKDETKSLSFRLKRLDFDMKIPCSDAEDSSSCFNDSFFGVDPIEKILEDAKDNVEVFQMYTSFSLDCIHRYG